MSFKTITVGLDFSASSLAALRLAQAVTSPGATFRLVHATDLRPFRILNAGAAFEAESLHEELARRARRPIADLATEARGRGFEAEIHIGSGRPADEILAHAEGGDLVVVGSHGHGALGRMLLGSVAEEVARRSTAPVLVVKEAGSRVARIVVAVDLAGPSRDAICLAGALAKDLGVPLEALHAVHFPAILPTSPLPPILPGTSSEPMLARAGELARRHVEAAPGQVQKLLDAAGVEGHVRVLVGVPGDVIPEHLRAGDLLVCGTHARQGLARVALGSVAARLLHRALCPVIVVPPSEEHEGGRP